ncbi:hypothetical protein BESB_016910 [Besnoitia besnoiti]|uniref:Uncharacterized protein n=1 Tax=Besnoitia besnoiti TaxID=94643 RepID=A0A2A9M9M6_BESBE|nr:hypothetical protein BESB_016910 [Besnoitia besnoiti]PFH32373.1 hypothetical protein BESB_016910 [Besnoitia besnoiti]
MSLFSGMMVKKSGAGSSAPPAPAPSSMSLPSSSSFPSHSVCSPASLPYSHSPSTASERSLHVVDRLPHADGPVDALARGGKGFPQHRGVEQRVFEERVSSESRLCGSAEPHRRLSELTSTEEVAAMPAAVSHQVSSPDVSAAHVSGPSSSSSFLQSSAFSFLQPRADTGACRASSTVGSLAAAPPQDSGARSHKSLTDILSYPPPPPSSAMSASPFSFARPSASLHASVSAVSSTGVLDALSFPEAPSHSVADFLVPRVVKKKPRSVNVPGCMGRQQQHSLAAAPGADLDDGEERARRDIGLSRSSSHSSLLAPPSEVSDQAFPAPPARPVDGQCIPCAHDNATRLPASSPLSSRGAGASELERTRDGDSGPAGGVASLADQRLRADARERPAFAPQRSSSVAGSPEHSSLSSRRPSLAVAAASPRLAHVPSAPMPEELKRIASRGSTREGASTVSPKNAYSPSDRQETEETLGERQPSTSPLASFSSSPVSSSSAARAPGSPSSSRRTARGPLALTAADRETRLPSVVSPSSVCLTSGLKSPPDAACAWYYVCRTDCLQQQREQIQRLARSLELQIATLNDLETLEKEQKTLEQQQEGHVANEDFEAAAKIDVELQHLQGAYDRKLGSLLDQGGREQLRAAQGNAEISRKLFDAVAKLHRQLTNIDYQRRDEREQAKQEARDRREREEREIEKESAALRERLRDCEETAQVTAASLTALGDREKEEEKAIETQLEQLEAEQIQTEEQINDLRQRLAALEAEWERRQYEMAELRQQQSKLKETLRREEDDLRATQRSLQERERVLEAEEEKLHRRREALEELARAADEEELEYVAGATALGASLASFAKRLRFLKSLHKFRRAIAERLRVSLSSAALERCQERMQQLGDERRELQAHLHSQEERRFKLRGEQQQHLLMLPLLEQEKALAVSSRHFKEAASFSAEIKQCQEAVDTLAAKLDACAEEIKRSQQQLDALEPELRHLRVMQLKQQREHQAQQKKLIREQLRILEKIRRACPSERDTNYLQALDEEAEVYRHLLARLEQTASLRSQESNNGVVTSAEKKRKSPSASGPWASGGEEEVEAAGGAALHSEQAPAGDEDDARSHSEGEPLFDEDFFSDEDTPVSGGQEKSTAAAAAREGSTRPVPTPLLQSPAAGADENDRRESSDASSPRTPSPSPPANLAERVAGSEEREATREARSASRREAVSGGKSLAASQAGEETRKRPPGEGEEDQQGESRGASADVSCIPPQPAAAAPSEEPTDSVIREETAVGLLRERAQGSHRGAVQQLTETRRGEEEDEIEKEAQSVRGPILPGESAGAERGHAAASAATLQRLLAAERQQNEQLHRQQELLSLLYEQLAQEEELGASEEGDISLTAALREQILSVQSVIDETRRQTELLKRERALCDHPQAEVNAHASLQDATGSEGEAASAALSHGASSDLPWLSREAPAPAGGDQRAASFSVVSSPVQDARDDRHADQTKTVDVDVSREGRLRSEESWGLRSSTASKPQSANGGLFAGLQFKKRGESKPKTEDADGGKHSDTQSGGQDAEGELKGKVSHYAEEKQDAPAIETLNSSDATHQPHHAATGDPARALAERPSRKACVGEGSSRGGSCKEPNCEGSVDDEKVEIALGEEFHKGDGRSTECARPGRGPDSEGDEGAECLHSLKEVGSLDLPEDVSDDMHAHHDKGSE